MGTTDLIQLIDLSLGVEPNGIVNLNYLHTLLHAIVNRLGAVEDAQLGAELHLGDGVGTGGGTAQARVGLGGEGVGAEEGADGTDGEKGGAGRDDVEGGSDKRDTLGGASDTEKLDTKTEAGSDGRQQQQQQQKGVPTSFSPISPTPLSSSQGGQDSKPPSRRDMRTSVTQLQKPKSGVASAANDLGAMERKLKELESRLNAMDTLPELLERKAADVDATPMRDRWNYTNLSKRLSAAEDNMDQSSKLVDDLLGELQSVKSVFAATLSQMGDKVSGMAEKIKALEELQLLATKDSMGEAATAMLTDLQNRLDTLQAELDSIKQVVETLDPSAYVTMTDLQSALLQQAEAAEESLQSSAEAVAGRMEEVEQRLGSLDTDMSNLMEQIEELKTTKVSVADLASLMPQGDGGETAGLLSKMVEMQGKLEQIEEELGKQPALPSDVLEQISTMQKAIDKLTADLAMLMAQGASGIEDKKRLEELGSEVAQLRERTSELDRAVTALSNTVSASRASPGPPTEEEDAKYADIDSFLAAQQLLNQLQQDQERLIGTTAHIANEIEISKEHVKSLYSSVDELRVCKADREQVEVEVREKADRAAMEGKASRDWVNSTFDQLDQQIREARDKLLGQEEALRSAVTQINEDVETKLDRLELEPLKEYFDKKLARVKTAPAVVEKEVMSDDAAGFRKPLRFRCISCDKPLGIRSHDPIPSLPSITTLRSTRSFRPYTTYELELIRRHQRMGLPVFGPVMEFSQARRSAGGSHTMTHPRRRVRVAPLSSAYSPEPYVPSRPSTLSEVDVVGQDGHIYKGRMAARKLPPVKDQVRSGRARHSSYPHNYHQ